MTASYKTSARAPTQNADVSEIQRWLSLVFRPGQRFEIRAPKSSSRAPSSKTCRGNALAAAATFAQFHSGQAAGVYYTLNPVRLDLKDGAAAKDKDITGRRLLLIDVDPVRPADTSATEAEKARARTMADSIRVFLCGLGWPKGALSDSGNGFHLIYAIDLPADDEGLVKKVLQALAARFDTPDCKVDTTVSNPSRICKLPGTMACKGENTPDRPHRMARVIEAPAELSPVPIELLNALVDDEKTRAALEADIERKRIQVKPTTAASTGQPKDKERPDAETRAILYLEKCEPAISGQKGHDKLLKAAKVGPGFDLPPEATFRLLHDHYNPRCKPHWSDRELQHKVDEAYKIEQRRGWLLNAGRNGHKGNGRHIGNGHAPAAVATPPVFRNFHWVEEEVKGKNGEVGTEHVRAPLRVGEIAATLTATAGEWPKRIDEDLFVQTADFRPVSLSSPARLFAWIDRDAPVDWTKGSQFITQERFYEGLRMSAEQFDSIETLPHFPPLPRTYYMHAALPKPTGALEELLNYFSPLTPFDRELIKAFLMTPLWGGQPGCRPAFLVTGPDRDEHQGRGIGKTTLFQIMGDEIFGGVFKARQSKDFDDMVTRLLSREARQKRIALLDNVKTYNFSWGDLEDLITSSVIGGRQLYVGDGSRPNYLVWAITLNGASLSKDMAQRVIPIKLARPIFKAGWESSVRTFAREHRAEILADVGDQLRNARVPITPATRWAAWEADVLAATIDPAATQKVIVERQGDVDAGNSDRDIVQDYFARKIREAGHDPDTAAVRFNAQIATQWSNEAMNRREDATRVGGFLRGLNIPELTPKSSHGVRSWTWRGTSADSGIEPFDLD